MNSYRQGLFKVEHIIETHVRLHTSLTYAKLKRSVVELLTRQKIFTGIIPSCRTQTRQPEVKRDQPTNPPPCTTCSQAPPCQMQPEGGPWSCEMEDVRSWRSEWWRESWGELMVCAVIPGKRGRAAQYAGIHKTYFLLGRTLSKGILALTEGHPTHRTQTVPLSSGGGTEPSQGH